MRYMSIKVIEQLAGHARDIVATLSKCNSTDWRNAMPLKKGTSKAAVSSNIKTLVNEWEKEGSIGSSHPATKQKAVKQAVAISLKKAGKSRNTQPCKHEK